MGLLAYDPDRVTFLMRAMRRALDELRTVRCSDPAAADAVRVVRTVAADLELAWLPLVDGVLATDALDVRAQRREHVDDLTNSLVRVMAGYGWSVAVDPMSPVATEDREVTAEEARALGARMNTLDATSIVDDPATLAWLTGRLERIAGDAHLTGEFLANFHEWGPWCDALGRQRALVVSGLAYDARTSAAQLDAVFTALGHVQRTDLRVDTECRDATALFPLVDRMTPYSAALLLGSMGLGGAALAGVVDHLLVRVSSAADGTSDPATLDLELLDGPDAADLLFAELLADPTACTHYLGLALRHPDTMFTAVDDITLAYRVALVATDPSHVDSSTAERLIVPLTDYFVSANMPHDIVVSAPTGTAASLFLVDLVSPWLLQFSPANDDWQLSVQRRHELLMFVLRDDAAMVRLLDDAERVTTGVISAMESGTGQRLDELAAFVAFLGDLIVNERVETEEARRRAWNLVCGVAGLLTVAIPGVAVAVGVSAALLVVQSSMGPDPDHARQVANYGADLALTTAAAAVLDRVFDELVADGTLPADFPPPPEVEPGAAQPSHEFILAFMDWRMALPGGEFGPVTNLVVRHVYTVLNPALMGANAVD